MQGRGGGATGLRSPPNFFQGAPSPQQRKSILRTAAKVSIITIIISIISMISIITKISINNVLFIVSDSAAVRVSGLYQSQATK